MRDPVPSSPRPPAVNLMRYLVASMDARHMVRPRRGAAPEAAPASPADPLPPPPADKPAQVKRPWLIIYNEFLWHDI